MKTNEELQAYLAEQAALRRAPKDHLNASIPMWAWVLAITVAVVLLMVGIVWAALSWQAAAGVLPF